MSRPSKIGRLPAALREALNTRLEAGEMARELLPWLNAELESQSSDPGCAGSGFVPITEQNLSDWRRGRFVEWQLRHEILESSCQVDEAAAEFAAVSLTSEHFLVCLKGRFASHLLAWDGTSGSPDLHRMQIIQRLITGVLGLRRSEQQADRLALDRERFEFTRDTRGERSPTAKAQSTAASSDPIAVASPPVATPPVQPFTTPFPQPQSPLLDGEPPLESIESIPSTCSTAAVVPSSAPATVALPGLTTPPLQTAPPPASNSNQPDSAPNDSASPKVQTPLPPKRSCIRSSWQMNLQQ